MSPNDFWTTFELAEHLGVSRSTLALWRKSKEGPPYCKFRNVIRYQRGEVEKWIASSSIEIAQ